MSIASSALSVASDHRPLDLVLIGAPLEEESGPAAALAPAAAPRTSPPAAPETVPGLDFRAILRSNLHAAAKHAALGHEARSFRQCRHRSCRDASNLIPYLVAAELGMTEAELDAIFNRVPDVAAKPELLEELVLAA